MENKTLVASITAQKGNEATMLELLKQLVVESRKENGCMRYDLHISEEKSNVFIMYEVWGSEKALEQHIQSSHFTEYKEKSKEILESLEVLKLKKID